MRTNTTHCHRRLIFRTLATTGALALAAIVIWPTSRAAAKAFSDSSEENRPNSAATEVGRLREGTKVERLTGHFKLTGDRVTFFTADGKQRLGGLENLALERVARTVKDSPSQLHWVVSGIITEYRGSNYLLVGHAVLKAERGEFAGR